jgi:(S)-3,5-dihydroxyphenylglycine transaminase
MVVLRRESMHASVSDPVATSMNFLNEVAGRYPDAISLAAGRPYEGFYETADVGRYLQIYLDFLAQRGHSEQEVRRLLMQYGRTNGQIHELIATLLRTDDGIEVPAEAICVTAGCQEAMIITLRGICAGPDDVLLAAEPCYVGITGAARILDIEVVPVPEQPRGIDAASVAEVAAAVRARGKRPAALYLVPDFSNPSGLCLDVPTRKALLDVAAREDLLILEDDPYGLFGIDDRPRPRLKSLDTAARVIYLGSFAKSCFPGARVGFLVADQTVEDAQGRRTLFAEELSTVKSMLTVNTSAIAQAVIGGILVESGCSLRAANAEKIAFYRKNLQHLMAALQREFPSPASGSVSWNAPAGGFFAVMTVPMPADEKLLEISAADYGVLWTPMSFFYTGGGGSRAIRLCCSYLEPDVIDEGVTRLAAMVRDRS